MKKRPKATRAASRPMTRLVAMLRPSPDRRAWNIAAKIMRRAMEAAAVPVSHGRMRVVRIAERLAGAAEPPHTEPASSAVS